MSQNRVASDLLAALTGKKVLVFVENMFQEKIRNKCLSVGGGLMQPINIVPATENMFLGLQELAILRYRLYLILHYLNQESKQFGKEC